MKHKVACRGCGELFMPSFQHRVYCSDAHKALAELLDGEESKHQAAVGRVLKLQGAEQHMLIEDLARHLPHPEPMFRNMPPPPAPAIPDNIPGVRLDEALAQARAFRVQAQQAQLQQNGWLRALMPLGRIEAQDEQRPLQFEVLPPPPVAPQDPPARMQDMFLENFDWDLEGEEG